MGRKTKAEVRTILSDPVHHNVLVTKFINSLMKGGKKSVAEKIFYGALQEIEDKTQTRRINLVLDGGGEREAGVGSPVPPCWWRDLSGAGRSPG